MALITTFVGVFILIILLIITFSLLLFAFWIWMIIDCAKRNFKKDIDKVVWMIIILFLSILVATIYYLAVMKNDKKK